VRVSGAGGLVAAFAAGMVSFLSPCVLPLVPGYISFMTGVAPAELEGRRPSVADVLVPSLLFVLGLAIVFVALGATASALGALLAPYRAPLSRLAGAFILVMGFLLLGVVRVPWLYGEARFDPARARSFGRGAALVLGMAFGFGWTPCVGPVLASILALAGSGGSVARGAALLLAYALGLGVPFVLVGLFFARLKGAVRWLSRHALTVNRVAGVLLMVLGALILTGRLAALAALVSRFLPLGVG
jgi:cytochrome c-type biogenesis protein